MTAAEFRDEKVNLGTCFCPKEQVPYILNSGRHAPDCHADERWVEDFDAMIASVVAESEARGRLSGLLAAAWAVESHRQWSEMFRGKPGSSLAALYWEGSDDALSDATGEITALAKEATDGR